MPLTTGRATDFITFTRASTATRVNASGLIETVSADTPRLDYDPVTLAAKGLLVEEQRTNLYLQSEAFDSSSWIKVHTTVTANATTSPDGTTDAELIIPSVNALAHQVYQSISLTNATAYTASIYAKAGGYNYVNIRFGGGIASEAFFDLSGGTVVSATTPANATIRAVGNGWYRCTYTATATSTASFAISINPCTTSNSYGLAGNGTSGVYVWGAQLEAGSFATSYIPTGSASATRAADVARVGASAFPYSATEGTIVANVTLAAAPSTQTFSLYALSDGTTSERVFAATGSGSGGNINTIVTDNGVAQAQTVNGSLASAGTYKYANVYKLDDFASVVNGGSAVTDTLGTLPTMDRLNIGSSSIDTAQLNGWVRQITYIPRRISNAELQSRTA